MQMKLKNLNFWRYTPGFCFSFILCLIFPLFTVVPVFIFIDAFSDAGAIVLSLAIIAAIAGAFVCGDLLFRKLKKHYLNKGLPDDQAQTQAEIIEKWCMMLFEVILIAIPVTFTILENV
jgi:hypothetical protein